MTRTFFINHAHYRRTEVRTAGRLQWLCKCNATLDLQFGHVGQERDYHSICTHKFGVQVNEPISCTNSIT